jgi:hypothetical protein
VDPTTAGKSLLWHIAMPTSEHLQARRLSILFRRSCSCRKSNHVNCLHLQLILRRPVFDLEKKWCTTLLLKDAQSHGSAVLHQSTRPRTAWASAQNVSSLQSESSPCVRTFWLNRARCLRGLPDVHNPEIHMYHSHSESFQSSAAIEGMLQHTVEHSGLASLTCKTLSYTIIYATCALYSSFAMWGNFVRGRQ